MSHTEQMREAFERHMSDDGKFPKAVERSGDGYRLLQTQNAWDAWKACAAAITAKTTTENTPTGMLSTTCPWCENGFAFEAPALTAPAAEVPTGKNWHAHHVAVDKAALQMIRNALRNDVERGMAVRGEMLEELDKATFAIPAPAATAAEVPEAMGGAPALPEAVDQLAQADGFNVIGTVDVFTADQLRTYAKQYAQWQSTRLRGGVPEGWKLVKEAPSIADCIVGSNAVGGAVDGKQCAAIFAAMSAAMRVDALTAAPQAPAAALDAGVVRDDFLQGVCVALQVVTSMDCGVTWREIVRAAGEDEILQYAAVTEPEEWGLAGFSRYAAQELKRGKPDAAMSAQAGKGGA